MAKHNYKLMVQLLKRKFQNKRVGIFPLEHGGAVEAKKLQPYLRESGLNFVLYERRGTHRDEENCLDQRNIYRFNEIRPVTTQPRITANFIRERGGFEKIVVLDSWSKSRGAPSLAGGWVYFLENAEDFDIDPDDVHTAAFRDYHGASDISPDKRNDEYNGTRSFVRSNCRNTYIYLVSNEFLQPDAADKILISVYRNTNLWTTISRKFKIRKTDDFVKAAIDALYLQGARLL